MSAPYQEELSVALRAVREASLICQSVQSQISPAAVEKQDRSPVTIADFGSQAAVCRALGDAFPNDPIIAEEDAAFLRAPENAEFLAKVQTIVAAMLGQATSEQVCEWIDRGCATKYSSRFWTLDPIDGTKGFLRKEQYAVSLALIVDGVIQLGVLGCPNLPEASSADPSGGTLFSAVRGQGAQVHRLASHDSGFREVHVSDCSQGKDARICESVESGHSSHGDSAEIASRLGTGADPVRLDSQAKYAVVARGEADVYLRLPTRPGYQERIWDHAGGVILIEEAGGRVSDVDGRALDWTNGSTLAANRGIVATNANLHDEVLSIVRDVMNRGEHTA